MLGTDQRSYTMLDHDLVIDVPDDSYVLRVRDLPDGDKPREKLLSGGPSSLSVAELVAILWGVGTRKEDVLKMAERAVKEYGEKTLAAKLDPQQLAEVAEIPLTKACQVVAALELGRRFYATQDGRPAYVRNSKQAWQYLRQMGASQKEQLRGLYLNSRYHVIHDEVISVGTLTSNIVHPREVFRPALEHGAVAVIVAHNHPSGILEPTSADVAVTRQLMRAGEILGVDLIDHLIVSAAKYKSVMEYIS